MNDILTRLRGSVLWENGQPHVILENLSGLIIAEVLHNGECMECRRDTETCEFTAWELVYAASYWLNIGRMGRPKPLRRKIKSAE